MPKREIENSATGNKMIIYDEYENPVDAFEIRMISENKPEPLLNFHRTKSDGVEKYSYDISCLQSIKELFEYSRIQYRDMVTIVGGLCDLIECIEEYLLSPECIILTKETFFINSNDNRAAFCYYPYKTSDFSESLRIFSEYILEKTDHNDKKAVDIAYEMYKQIVRGNTNIRYLIKDKIINDRSSENSYAKELISCSAGEKNDINTYNDFSRISNQNMEQNSLVDKYRSSSGNESRKKSGHKDSITKVIVFFTIVIACAMLVVVYVIMYSMNLI